LYDIQPGNGAGLFLYPGTHTGCHRLQQHYIILQQQLKCLSVKKTLNDFIV